MKLARCLDSHLTPPLLVIIAGVLLATLGVAYPDGQAASEPIDGRKGMNTPRPATAREKGREVPGVSGDHVLFGQSAAFTGPNKELGKAMRLGIEAAFHEANREGGVHRRELRLKALDDAYETDIAASNTLRLIENQRVFALIGAVGTPTSRAALPLAKAAGVPFLAPFTGAEFLRDQELDNVLNVRASYYQETEEMVTRLTEDLGITRVAVLYQEDSFGLNGLEGTRLALERRGLQPVVASHYQRNTGAVKGAANKIAAANPEAVILIGSYKPVVRTLELVRRELDPVFMTVSFVGSNALAKELGPDGAGVYVTQVVPLPHDKTIPLVARYHAALSEYDPQAEPGFVSLEGYLAGRLAVVGLKACGPDLSRECLLHAVRDAGAMEIDGMQLKYGPDDNQGSDAVFLTVLGTDGKYHRVEKLTRP